MNLATATRAELVAALDETVVALQHAYLNRARVQSAELETKTAAWFAGPADTIAARDRSATQAAMNFSKDLFLHEGEIRSLETLRAHLVWRLDHWED